MSYLDDFRSRFWGGTDFGPAQAQAGPSGGGGYLDPAEANERDLLFKVRMAQQFPEFNIMGRNREGYLDEVLGQMVRELPEPNISDYDKQPNAGIEMSIGDTRGGAPAMLPSQIGPTIPLYRRENNLRANPAFDAGVTRIQDTVAARKVDPYQKERLDIERMKVENAAKNAAARGTASDWQALIKAQGTGLLPEEAERDFRNARGLGTAPTFGDKLLTVLSGALGNNIMQPQVSPSGGRRVSRAEAMRLVGEDETVRDRLTRISDNEYLLEE